MKNAILKNALLPVATAAALACTVPAVQAAQVEVSWENPQSFRDIEPANATRGHYQERVLNTLAQYFRDAGERLPDGQTLTVNITDVDLAGTVEYFHPNYPFGVRTIRQVDFPRIRLDYVLSDADGNVINSGSGNLSDLGFQFPVYATRYREPLQYEKRMIDRWYSTNFG